MSQTRTSPVSFTATEELEAYRRVKLTTSSGSAVEYADQSDSSSYIGVTLVKTAINEEAAIALKGVQNTFKCEAADTFAVGATLYAADDGKVSDSSSGNAIGTALEACTAAGDIVEVLLDNGGGTVSWTRASLVQEDLAAYPILFNSLKVWDAPVTPAVITTAANDDLAVVYGTWGTANLVVNAGDLKNAGATTMKIGFSFALPSEYVAAQTITLRINALTKTTVASVSSTVDVNAYNNDGPTVDICATAAQSINAITAANKDFTLTPTDCAPGDIIDVVITVACNDSGTGTAVIPTINSMTMLLDIKG